MSDEIEFDAESSATTWAAFGDLMSVLLGAFVLILASVIGIQLLLHKRLDEEVQQRQAEAAKLKTLEEALAFKISVGRFSGKTMKEVVDSGSGAAITYFLRPQYAGKPIQTAARMVAGQYNL